MRHLIYITALLLVSVGCNGLHEKEDRLEDVIVTLSPGIVQTPDYTGAGLRNKETPPGNLPAPHGNIVTKSEDPDETRLSDINLFVFASDGSLETFRYEDNLQKTAGGVQFQVSLIRNLEYSIYACANFGYPMSSIRDEAALLSYRFHLAYPDEYRAGIPMSGKLLKIKAGNSPQLKIDLIRMMSRISLCIDRTGLDKDIRLLIRSVEIGNCPRSANAFTSSRVMNNRDVFSKGFGKAYSEVDALNRDSAPGKSEELSVYMLENKQGRLLENIKDDREKHLENNKVLKEVCSYIEIKAEYSSASMVSEPGEYLIYRFFPGENIEDFSIERNARYRFTIKPEGCGVSESSWRVDKTYLSPRKSGSIRILPSDYIEGRVGDTVHIRVETEPPSARCDIGLEELEFDRERGIYTYEMDDDGRGVKLQLTRRGSGILYFYSGEAENESAIAVIIVN